MVWVWTRTPDTDVWSKRCEDWLRHRDLLLPFDPE